MAAMFSPANQFAGRSVLLTGSLGFLGGVVLEQLLRLTEVKSVFVLVRGKKHMDASERLAQLLSSPVFNLLHKQATDGQNVFDKVRAVEGDLLLPGLGISPDDKELLQQVDFVLHCAASVELQADIQRTLCTNYFGTQQLMQLASSMPNLLAFVHVSTYYACNHLPRNSLVKEQLHPLQLSLNGAATPVNHAEFVAALMAMQPAEANAAADAVMQANSFGSRYAFGKNLTEQMVADTHIAPGVAKAIVRPSVICSVAGSPYPGYLQGYAGPGGYAAAYGMGFFQGLSSVAYGSDQVTDLIPCDTVAALVIAAAAAAAADAEQQEAATAEISSSSSSSNSTTIYHASSSASYPLPIVDAFAYMADYWEANPPPLRLPFTKYVRVTRPHTPTEHGTHRGLKKCEAKAQLLASLMQLTGKRKHAYRLLMGVKCHAVQNSLPLAASMICSVDNVLQLQQRIVPQEKQHWPIVWGPGQPTGMPWRTYFFTFLSAVRQLLLRVPTPENRRAVCHPGLFLQLQPADSELVCSLMLGGSIGSSVASSSAADNDSSMASSCSDNSSEVELSVPMTDSDSCSDDKPAEQDACLEHCCDKIDIPSMHYKCNAEAGAAAAPLTQAY